MILMSAIVNITSNLDTIRQQDGKTISSHVKLKEEALECLKKLIDQAPINEYKDMLESKNCDILIGYLMSVLFHMAKEDKSRSVRLNSLEVMNILIKRLGHHHSQGYTTNKCAIRPFILALPGVSSKLIKVIISDTKLNHKILVMAIKTLSSFLEVCFISCDHEMNQDGQPPEGVFTEKLEGKHLIETCDNLAARIRILLEYIMNNNHDLHSDVGIEMIHFISTLISCHQVLFERLIRSIIRFVASLKSHLGDSSDNGSRVLKATNSLIDHIKTQLDTKENDSSSIDLKFSVLDCLSKILDNLENNAVNMLLSERQTELAALHGILAISPAPMCAAFMEVPNRREQFLKVLTKLTKFDTQQHLLFLTDTRVGEQALEPRNGQVYTLDKRFSHITGAESAHIRNCCLLIGQKIPCSMLADILSDEVIDFTNASRLYLAYHMIEGLLEHSDSTELSRFARRTLSLYINQVQENNAALSSAGLDDTCSNDLLKIVIAIETLALFVELYIKHSAKNRTNVIILKDLLCPLLNWCSSKSRAISETSLNTLTKIGCLYGYKSTIDFIGQFTDYIVDGVTHMLNNFACNPDVTNVLAITFKLASIDVFYYFQDIYERVFRLLEAYHYTDRSKSIALLFYRTLTIISDWKDAEQVKHEIELPLKSEFSIKTVIKDLDIDLRIDKLRQMRIKSKKLNQEMEAMLINDQSEDQKSLEKQLEVSDILMEQENNDNGSTDDVDESNKKKKSDDIILTEKILKHCIGLMSSRCSETKILSLKTAACGLKILKDDEDILLPLVHQLWPPLLSRLTGDYNQNLEINLCAFECLATMAFCAKDFIKQRTLDSIIPRVCLFLESQASQSRGKKEYGPYCMTMAYKCQLKLLEHLGQLAENIQLGYSNLWRIIRVALCYLEQSQVASLREAARTSLLFMIVLDADCVWYYAKHSNQLHELPFELIYESF